MSRGTAGVETARTPVVVSAQQGAPLATSRASADNDAHGDEPPRSKRIRISTDLKKAQSVCFASL